MIAKRHLTPHFHTDPTDQEILEARACREAVEREQAEYADAVDHLVRLLERQVTGPAGWPSTLRFPAPHGPIKRRAFTDFLARLEAELGHPVAIRQQ